MAHPPASERPPRRKGVKGSGNLPVGGKGPTGGHTNPVAAPPGFLPSAFLTTGGQGQRLCEGVDGALSGVWLLDRAPGTKKDGPTVTLNEFSTSSAGKQRIFIDARHQNAVITDRDFRYKSLKEKSPQLHPGDHLLGWDFKDTYHRVPLTEL